MIGRLGESKSNEGSEGISRLRQLVQSGFMTAKRIIEGGEEATPVFLILSADGQEVGIVATPFSGDGDKQAVADFIREYLKRERSSACVFVCEAWVREVAHGQAWDGVQPSKCEGRSEALVVSGESRSGETYFLQAMIDRDGANKRTVRVPDEGTRQAIGRFVGLFDEAAPY